MLALLWDLDVADEQWQFRISTIGGKGARNCLSEPGMANLLYNAGPADELSPPQATRLAGEATSRCNLN